MKQLNSGPLEAHPGTAVHDRFGVGTTPVVRENSSRSRFSQWIAILGRWLWGTTLSMHPLTGLWVLGWTQQLAGRQVHRCWWERCGARRQGLTWEVFHQLERHPRGELTNSACSQVYGTAESWNIARWRAWIAVTGRCVLTGIAAAFNAWVLTAPGGFLWAASWYAGWQNSFNKGYEHAWFGPSAFLLGTVWFSVAMTHVPLGLARQASTGDWRRFYDFRLIWSLLHRRCGVQLALAAGWVTASMLAVALRSLPPFLAGYAPEWTDLGPFEAARRAYWMYWILALGLFPVFVATRIWAAKVYAVTLFESYETGTLREDSLSESESHAFRRLGLLTSPVEKSPRASRLNAVRRTFGRTARSISWVVIVSLWLGFSIVNLLGEFLVKTDLGRGWWSQSMIQIPWFNHTPHSLRLAAQAEPKAETPNEPVERIP